MMQQRRTASAIGLVMLLIAVGCSGESNSYDEYAQTICGLASVSELESGTWSDTVRVLDDALEVANDMTPPEELTAFHETQTELFEAMRERALEYPSDGRADFFGLASIRALDAVMELDSMKDTLNANVSAPLYEHGCFEDQ